MYEPGPLTLTSHGKDGNSSAGGLYVSRRIQTFPERTQGFVEEVKNLGVQGFGWNDG